MGTSVNQRSPQTPNWRAVWLGYENDLVPTNRVAQELWRAATNQPEGNLVDQLASPLVAECLGIAAQSATPQQALSQASQRVALSGQASLGADLALRAVVQSFSAPERVGGFVESLFREASNYLVARDLSGFVGSSSRTDTVAKAAEFKGSICGRVGQQVRAQKPTASVTNTPQAWSAFVGTIVGQLRGDA